MCLQPSIIPRPLREQGSITCRPSCSGHHDWTPCPCCEPTAALGIARVGPEPRTRAGSSSDPNSRLSSPDGPAGELGTESPPADARHKHREESLSSKAPRSGFGRGKRGPRGPRACAGPPPFRPAPGIGRGRRGGGGGDAAPASRRRSASTARPSLNTPGRAARSSRELPGAAARARSSGSGCRGTAPPGARPAAAYAGTAALGEPWTAAGCRPPWRKTRRS